MAERAAYRPSPCSHCGSERLPEAVEWGHTATWNGPGDGNVYWVIGVHCPGCRDEAASRVG